VKGEVVVAFTDDGRLTLTGSLTSEQAFVAAAHLQRYGNKVIDATTLLAKNKTKRIITPGVSQ
jgi:NAD+--asparagine ADP-ribosyltransferase